VFAVASAAKVRHTARMTTERRVALVTGGTRGIGLGVARALAREGFSLALCGRRAAADVAEALKTLEAPGIDVLYRAADVSERGDRDALLAAVRERFGRLDLLVNNAGVAPARRADLLEADEESFDFVVRTNLRGPYFLTQAAARWMVDQHAADAAFQGTIVFVTSVSAEAASPNRGEYCVSKAGLSMAARLFAVRLAESGARVYEVRPGIVRTDMTAGVRAAYDRRMADGLLLQPRWGLPDDVGRAVAALARGDLPYSTGAVIPVDGGFSVPRL
jgi:NAD(P)-dependent dehydrogenase (short-subunit alcohol dehydrogenase family)